ncbi:histidinol-phosphate transaminase [Saccharicrinis fermentans]|uniref:Histidinol-phosphate aminotransferase n=1 Tax=Saccharicrinis fermentans DSM 9555 = JCM 21142 TaxID=869213 RepID=W7XUK2_9BACT|nr:histidinol-phosphate transaminase [Saccharicrinis fermentans]GAF01695.1 histidinol-phosphate aminotransferase [Saccharicrinis fermentans DSM 9555 = JCM 21142]
MKTIEQLIRPNIKSLRPYSSARDEFSGEQAIFLDANENPFNKPYNRYPDPYQRKLKKKIGELKDIEAEHIFLGNGSDEAIDLTFRSFCEPGIDNVISIDPTYGMYQVAADINNIEIRKVKLTKEFQLDVDGLLAAADQNSKILFICSPNNPTGNCFPATDILSLLDKFNGIVVLDEAYIDFAPEKSFLPHLAKYPNLIILQTFSKAWGMAGIRLGMAFTSPEIIHIFNHIKYPYNINILTQQTALQLLEKADDKNTWVQELLRQKEQMSLKMKQYPFIQKIFPSDANYLLIKTTAPKEIYNFLVDQGVIVRDRSTVSLCEGCLRVTIGSKEENNALYAALDQYQNK